MNEAAVAISSAFSSRPSLQPSSGNPLGSSPAKLIDSRSKCYKQLSDINNLKLSGVLSEEEYCCEKEAVLSVLQCKETVRPVDSHFAIFILVNSHILV